MDYPWYPCRVMRVPDNEKPAAARLSSSINPANTPPIRVFTQLGIEPSPQRIAVITSKYWGPAGVHATVSFMEPTAAVLQERIVSHMNAWSKYANITFSIFHGAWGGADCRISRGPGGYYSYEGTDNAHIPKNQQTMNLQAFDMHTPESEYVRVVRHETGHYFGCEHEHKRSAIVQRLDPQKTIALFERTQGWSEADIREQILTPDLESDLTATPIAFVNSIMTYNFPASITVDGVEIPGGTDITPEDGAFIGILYPLVIKPPPPPPSPSNGRQKGIQHRGLGRQHHHSPNPAMRATNVRLFSLSGCSDPIRSSGSSGSMAAESQRYVRRRRLRIVELKWTFL